MKACVGVRKKEMCSLTKADLVVVNPRDVILKITSAAICGSDLHLLQWFDADDGKGPRPVLSRWGKSSQSAARTLSLTPMIRAAVPFALMLRVLLLSQGLVPYFATHRTQTQKSHEKRWGQSRADLFAYSHMFDAFAENKC